MRIDHRLVAIACAVLAAGLALPAAAAEKDSGFYFDVGVGPNFGPDPGVKISGASTNGDLDAGIRAAVAVGYDFNKYLSAQLETGYIWNTFEHFHGAFGHIPYLVDGLFRYPLAGGSLEPYVGAGLGGSADLLHIHDFGLDDTDVDVNFAWQAMAGMRFRIQNNMYLGIGYKYFGVTGSAYNIDGEHVHVGVSQNHAVNVAFKMRF